MSQPVQTLRRLSRQGLETLAAALDSGRLHPPYSPSLVDRHVSSSLHKEIAAELQDLHQAGMQALHIALLARGLAAERAAARSVADSVELVWSGMDVLGAVTRDTRVVIQELFKSAKKSVLISTYVLDDNDKARSLFGPLAENMDTNPELETKLFVNIQRDYQDDQTPDSEILRRFADRFRTKIWPGQRLPEVYYDPRALAKDWKQRASLHAKCVVVDEEKTLITSANFTQAAQERNIEAGFALHDKTVARSLKMQYYALLSARIVRPIAVRES